MNPHNYPTKCYCGHTDYCECVPEGSLEDEYMREHPPFSAPCPTFKEWLENREKIKKLRPSTDSGDAPV